MNNEKARRKALTLVGYAHEGCLGAVARLYDVPTACFDDAIQGCESVGVSLGSAIAALDEAARLFRGIKKDL